MTVHLNDQSVSVEDGTTLLELLKKHSLSDKKGVAVAINEEIVSRPNWHQHVLQSNDRILMITATQGG